MDEETANAVIMAARAHWFDDGEGSGENHDGDETAAAPSEAIGAEEMDHD
jgi:hypothetical protein